MGHNDHGHPLGGQVAHDGEHLSHDLGVEGRGGLIEQHEVGLHAEGAGNGNALLLPAREGRDGGMREAREPNGLEVAHRLGLGLLPAHLAERDGSVGRLEEVDTAQQG